MKNELTIYAADPIAAELITKGAFEATKYDLVNGTAWDRQIFRLRPASIAEAIQTPAPTVATYRKYKGDTETKLILAAMIKGCADAFNVGKKMSDTQVLMTVAGITRNYYFFNLADIKHCFDRAIMGEYGPLYDRLDTNTILEWLRQYREERLGVAAFLAEQQHHDRKNERVNPKEVNHEIMKKMGEFADELEKKRKEKWTAEPEPEKVKKDMEHMGRLVAIEQCTRERWEAEAANLAAGETCDLYNKYGNYKLYYQQTRTEIMAELDNGGQFSELIQKYFSK